MSSSLPYRFDICEHGNGTHDRCSICDAHTAAPPASPASEPIGWYCTSPNCNWSGKTPDRRDGYERCPTCAGNVQSGKVWCETCGSWRHTQPCGRDECPVTQPSDAASLRDAFMALAEKWDAECATAWEASKAKKLRNADRVTYQSESVIWRLAAKELRAVLAQRDGAPR